MARTLEDVAREAATDLAKKYQNDDIVFKTDTFLKYGTPTQKVEREGGLGLDPISIAILVVHCAQFALEIYHTVKDKAALAREIRSNLKSTSGASEEQVKEVINSIVDKVGNS